MYAVYTEDMIVAMANSEEDAIAQAQVYTGLESDSDWCTGTLTSRMAHVFEQVGGSGLRWYETDDGLDLFDEDFDDEETYRFGGITCPAERIDRK